MSYKDNPMYGRMKQKESAIRSGANYAVEQEPFSRVDEAFVADEEQRKLQLTQMGEQKRQFDRGLSESKRQFDVGMKEGNRQFGIKMGMAFNEAKYRRRQNRKAAYIGLLNIAAGLGGGLLEHMEKSEYLRKQKQMMDSMDMYILNMNKAQEKGE
jgi:hypothetical protein